MIYIRSLKSSRVKKWSLKGIAMVFARFERVVKGLREISLWVFLVEGEGEKGREKGVSQGLWVMIECVCVRERGKLVALYFSVIVKGFCVAPWFFPSHGVFHVNLCLVVSCVFACLFCVYYCIPTNLHQEGYNPNTPCLESPKNKTRVGEWPHGWDTHN